MATREEIEELFRERGINFAEPGFYDGAAFQRCESQDPRFLENYAEYVHACSFDSEYLNRARIVIRKLAVFLAAELASDGRTGACTDASGALTRMLEREGIWSCMVAGAATVFFPPDSGLDRRYFSPLVHPNNPAKTGHMWLFAPPYKVVDITLRMQGWDQPEAEHIPAAILTEQWKPAQADIDDLMESELADLIYRNTRQEPTMASLGPQLVLTMKKFPAFFTAISGTQIKYVPTQISAMDGTLERMRNLQLNGRYPLEIYRRFLEQRANRPEG